MKQLTSSYQLQGPLLDVGCGDGRWHGYYPSGWVGVDLTDKFRNIRAAAQCLPFQDGAFASVAAITCIQHVPPEEKQEALVEIVRVLQHDGRFLFIEGAGHTSPDNNYIWGMTLEELETFIQPYFTQLSTATVAEYVGFLLGKKN